MLSNETNVARSLSNSWASCCAYLPRCLINVNKWLFDVFFAAFVANDDAYIMPNWSLKWEWQLFMTHGVHAYSVSQKKSPPEDLWQFFKNGCEFFNQILQAYYAFLSTLDYELLFNYLQLWRSYAHIKRDHPVHITCAKCSPSAETHAGIFWHFSQTVRNFYTKFYTPIKRSYLHWNANFYSIISNCDEVMPY